MRKDIIFAVVAGVVGVAVGYFIGKKRTERKIEKELEEPRIIRLYPEAETPDDEENLDEFDPEDAEGEISAEDIARENGYIPEDETVEEYEERTVIEASERFAHYMEKHAGEISVISPDYEKRSDELNNALDFVEQEMLLYFPDEGVLTNEEGDRLEIEDYVGNCLYKYGFATDDRQTEMHVLNVPYQAHYIVRRETENTVDELFPE